MTSAMSRWMCRKAKLSFWLRLLCLIAFGLAHRAIFWMREGRDSHLYSIIVKFAVGQEPRLW
jgi:hypothetical protein